MKFCVNPIDDPDKDCIETKKVTNTICLWCCMQTMMMAINNVICPFFLLNVAV